MKEEQEEHVCCQTKITLRKHNSEEEKTINTLHLHGRDSLYHSVSHSLFFPAHILARFGFLTSISNSL